VERRLTAVLAADVAGYSRLMGRDEEGTLAHLKTLRTTLVDPTIAAFRGRIVKTTGDGMLVAFGSAVDAVRCAIEVQRAMAAQNAVVLVELRIEFRIGIHVDDIMIDDDDIFGDGVNIAARLEALCEQGGICISGAAYDQVRNKLPFAFVDLGSQKLKNIAQAVRVYGLAAKEIAALRDEIREPGAAGLTVDDRSGHRPVRHSAGERGARPSLAVLPFDNLSHNVKIESFCDGLAEDAITALSRFRWLNVVSRNSSFAQKGRSIDVRKIARDLGVRFVLEGSVRKSDRRIRITAQLIDGGSGNHIWAERYDRDYSDLFDLQDEITGCIVASVEYMLWTALVRGNSHIGPPDPEISPLRAAGWHIIECTHAGNRAALACASRALQANPKSVAGYQYVANAYIAELLFGWTDNAEADLQNLLEAGRRAIALSPADSLSQGLYGLALAFGGNHDEALSCARRALALNSNSVIVLGPCGNVLSFSEAPQQANEMLERTIRLAPAHYFRAGFLSQMALNWLRLGQPERGLRLASEASKLKPEAPRCHIVSAAILVALDHSKDAKAATSEAYRYRPDINRALIRTMFPHRDRSVPDHLAGVLEIA
jgi:adenylate cyclase